MTIPAGIQRKTKNNANKLYRNRAAWMEAKKTNRPYQMFDETTGKWRTIMLPKKVTDA